MCAERFSLWPFVFIMAWPFRMFLIMVFHCFLFFNIGELSGLLWIDSGVVSCCHLYGFEVRLFLLIDWLPQSGKIPAYFCYLTYSYKDVWAVYRIFMLEKPIRRIEFKFRLNLLHSISHKCFMKASLLAEIWSYIRIYFWHPFLVRPRTFQQTPFYKAKTTIFQDINVISLNQTMTSFTTWWILLFPGVIFLNGMSFQDVSDHVSPQNLHSIHFYALSCILGKDSRMVSRCLLYGLGIQSFPSLRLLVA